MALRNETVEMLKKDTIADLVKTEQKLKLKKKTK
jgi:hypothetical protein